MGTPLRERNSSGEKEKAIFPEVSAHGRRADEEFESVDELAKELEG